MPMTIVNTRREVHTPVASGNKQTCCDSFSPGRALQAPSSPLGVRTPSVQDTHLPATPRGSGGRGIPTHWLESRSRDPGPSISVTAGMPIIFCENALADPQPWKKEVATLQVQVKAIFDMLHDKGQSLAMEAQQRVELQKTIEAECSDRVREFRELCEEMGGEREERGQDRLSVKEALQAEVDARIADVRQLARSLQSECNARAGEVKQLAEVFQSEREARVQEAEELAQALRAEFAGRPGSGRGQLPVQDRNSWAGTIGGASAGGEAIGTLQPETTQRKRLKEHTLMARDEHTREMQEWRRESNRSASGRMGASMPTQSRSPSPPHRSPE